MSAVFAFSKELFIVPNGLPMNFHVSRCQNAEELEEYIKYGGGSVKQSLGQFTILIEDTRQNPQAPPDSFNSEFIIQCCSQNKILPLKQFRLNSVSMFSEDFDPNDILLHKMSWKGAEQKYKKASDDSEGSETDLSSSEVDSDFSPKKKARNSRNNWKRSRNPYTAIERKAIIQFIVENKAFTEISGVAMWKRMQRKIPTHTWHSLKEHFLKFILPSIGSYELTPTEINCFRLVKPEKKLHKNSSYTSEEDRLILEYVQKHADKSTPLGGNQFWIKMQKRKHCIKGRTWQSVRERYSKVLKDKCPLNEEVSDDPSEDEDGNVSPSPEPEDNSLKKPLKPTNKKRRLFCAQTASLDFSPVVTPEKGLSLMEKQFNNTKNKSSDRIKQLSAAVTAKQVQERGLDDAVPSTSGCETVRQLEVEQNVGSVDSVIPTSISQPTREGDEELQERLLESSTCNGDQDGEACSESLGDSEKVVFLSDCEEGSDSDWSDDGLFWRGGIELPDHLPNMKRHPFAHLKPVPLDEYLSQANGKLKSPSSELCKAPDEDQSIKKKADCVNSKKRTHSEITSTSIPPKSQNGRRENAEFNFYVDNSYDKSQQNHLNDTDFNDSPLNGTCERLHVSTARNGPECNNSVVAQSTLRNNSHVATQTEPVTILPISWLSKVLNKYEVMCYMSNSKKLSG